MTNGCHEALTSKQRVSAVLGGRPFDRIPVNLLISDHAAQFARAPVTEYESSAELLVKGQIEAYRHYGHDFISVGPGLAGIPEAIGAKVVIPANSNPYVAAPALEKLSDIEKLRCPDPESTARLPVFLKAAELATREVGDEVRITMTIAAPFTTACSVFGTEKLLRELRRNSAAVHQLLRLVTDTIVAFSRAAIQRGVMLGLADPTASGSVVGKNAFETFALPYLTEVVQTIAQATGRKPLEFGFCQTWGLPRPGQVHHSDPGGLRNASGGSGASSRR